MSWTVNYDEFFAPELREHFADPHAVTSEVVALLQELIRNSCVNDGKDCQEVRNIKVLQRFFDKYGIPYEVHSRPDAPHRPNLLASYGSGHPRVMLGPSHVDVVPVDGHNHTDCDHAAAKTAVTGNNPASSSASSSASASSSTSSSAASSSSKWPGWERDPFGGEIIDNEVWGRGAVDMLNVVACQAVAFAHIYKHKKPINGTLLFCAVSDEENGSTYGVDYLMGPQAPADLKQKFSADYALSEIGGFTMPDGRGQPTRTYVMSNGEKGVCWVRISAKGKPGHGSIPANGDNALVRIAKCIERIQAYEPPTVVTPEWYDFVHSLDASWVEKKMLTNTVTLPRIRKMLLSKGNPLGPIADALTKLTMSPNHAYGSTKTNVVPGICTLEVDCRTLPGQDEQYVLGQIRKALGPEIANDTEHYTIEVLTHNLAGKSSTTSLMWNAMKNAAASIVPGATLTPNILTGSTDLRYYRLAGAQSYGAFLTTPDMTFGKVMDRFHGLNERIDIGSLWTATQFYTLSCLKVLDGTHSVAAFPERE